MIMAGITPIFQVLRSVLQDSDDQTTKIWLLYANKTEDDILLREELERFCSNHAENRVKVHYTLGTVPEGWKYSSGRINDRMMKEHLPAASSCGMVLACGPDAMMSEVVQPGLERLGWDTEESLVIF